MNIASSPNINYLWADLMIEELIRNGVETFCISPGSRSSTLTMAVANNPKAKSLVHFDERGSAFRALGIISATRKPCVVITTSGTAAANVFPAVIEASKKKLPLIVLTADRPPELQFTGAHQTIDQNKIYGDYARWFINLPCPTEAIQPGFVLTTIDQAVSRARGNPGGPVHLNCMVREPLAPTKVTIQTPSYTKAIQAWQFGNAVYTNYIRATPQLQPLDIDLILANVHKIKSGVIVVGKLLDVREQRSVLKLAEKLNWPVFADISSGLRLGNTHANIIHYFDQILLSDEFQKRYQPDGILHLGGRITSKRWYEYIENIAPRQYMMVLNHPFRNDPLHNVTMRVQCKVGRCCDSLAKRLTNGRGSKLLSQSQKLNTSAHQLIEEFFHKDSALSEPLTARLITQLQPRNSALFVSSSMPIREIDSYGVPDGNPLIFGSNRGASGIDGTIATAAGFADALEKRTTLLTGDLAFLYDLNSLSMVRELKNPMVIVVQNNNGGGIFSFLPIHVANKNFEKYFGTPHHLTFHGAAELFGLNYTRVDSPDEFAKIYSVALKSQTSTIIEVPTERSINFKIHQQIQTLVKETINQILNKTEPRPHHDKKYNPIRTTPHLDNGRKLRRYQVR